MNIKEIREEMITLLDEMRIPYREYVENLLLFSHSEYMRINQTTTIGPSAIRRTQNEVSRDYMMLIRLDDEEVLELGDSTLGLGLLEIESIGRVVIDEVETIGIKVLAYTDLRANIEVEIPSVIALNDPHRNQSWRVHKIEDVEFK